MKETTMDDEWPHEAQDKWYDKHDGRCDSPSVTVWMPTSIPHGRLQTTSHGCSEPETLPIGPAVAYLTIGGVQFGGWLDDLELMFAAAMEQLGNVRRYHQELLKNDSNEGNE